MEALVTLPDCVSALRARDLLEEGIRRARVLYGDAPTGTLGDSMERARLLKLRFDRDVPTLWWLRGVEEADMPTFCRGSMEHHELTGALTNLGLELEQRPVLNQIPTEIAGEAIDAAGDWFAGLPGWLTKAGVIVGIGLLVLLVVKWRVQA